ncbi:MAG: YIP1 family protein [Synergistaceae bacterium]|nr:YIP1 family protein [Synergistaceae bacterium]
MNYSCRNEMDSNNENIIRTGNETGNEAGNETEDILESSKGDKSLNMVDRLTRLFLAPQKLAENIKAFPSFRSAYLLIAILLLPSIFQNQIVSGIRNHEISAEIANRFAAIDNQLANQLIEQFNSAVNSSLDSAFVIYCVMIIVVFVSSAFIALLFHIFVKLFKGKGEYRQHFSLISHMFIVLIFGVLFNNTLIIFTGNTNGFLALSYFLYEKPEYFNFLYWITTTINIFSLWITVIIYFGIKKINEFSASKSIAFSGVFLLIYSISMASMTSFSMGTISNLFR